MNIHIKLDRTEVNRMLLQFLTGEERIIPRFPLNEDDSLSIELDLDNPEPNYYLHTNEEAAKTNKIQLIKLVRAATKHYSQLKGIVEVDEFKNNIYPAMSLSETKSFIEHYFKEECGMEI